MKYKKISTAKICLCVFLIFVLVCIVLKPSVYMQATLQGVIVWANAVLPSLFPFFFLTTILLELNALNSFSKVLKRPLKLFFNVSGDASFVYIMSIISGYPVGAKLIYELYKNNKINTFEAVRINAFTSNSGPAFILGTIGFSMLNNQYYGVIILLSHYLSAFINGFLYRNYGAKTKTTQSLTITTTNNMQDLLGNTIKQSVLSVLIVGGYIALSFMFCAFLTDTKIINVLCAPVNFLLSLFNLPDAYTQSIILGLTEITRGCLDLSMFINTNTHLIIVLISGIIAFGGVSVALQSLTYLKQCKVSTKVYILQKFTQAILAIIISSFMVLII